MRTHRAIAFAFGLLLAGCTAPADDADMEMEGDGDGDGDTVTAAEAAEVSGAMQVLLVDALSGLDPSEPEKATRAAKAFNVSAACPGGGTASSSGNLDATVTANAWSMSGAATIAMAGPCVIDGVGLDGSLAFDFAGSGPSPTVFDGTLAGTILVDGKSCVVALDFTVPGGLTGSVCGFTVEDPITAAVDIGDGGGGDDGGGGGGGDVQRCNVTVDGVPSTPTCWLQYTADQGGGAFFGLRTGGGDDIIGGADGEIIVSLRSPSTGRQCNDAANTNPSSPDYACGGMSLVSGGQAYNDMNFHTDLLLQMDTWGGDGEEVSGSFSGTVSYFSGGGFVDKVVSGTFTGPVTHVQ